MSEEKQVQWMPMEEARKAFHQLRNSINNLQLENRLLNVKCEQMEKEMKEQSEREKKTAEQLDEMMKLMVQINTSMKIANLIAKFFAWAGGVVLGFAGIWYSRHG